MMLNFQHRVPRALQHSLIWCTWLFSGPVYGHRGKINVKLMFVLLLSYIGSPSCVNPIKTGHFHNLTVDISISFDIYYILYFIFPLLALSYCHFSTQISYSLITFWKTPDKLFNFLTSFPNRSE